MEFFRIKKDIPFMKHALIFNAISFLTFAAAVFFLFSKGLNLSIEFRGGTVMELRYPGPAPQDKIRAELIKLGYDDVVNLKGLHATEFAARVAAIFNRYRLTEEKTQRLTKYIGSLSDICEISKLTRSQRLVLEALFDARDYFCRYGHLRTIIARNYNTPSLMHLRVIIHGIKAHMKPGHAIENVRGLGYRITFQEKP